MKIDKMSPWYLVYTAVGSAVLLVVMYLIFDDEVDWFMVLLLSAAVVVGVLIARGITASRRR